MDSFSNGIAHTLIVVVIAILIDTVLGAISGAKFDLDGFDFRKLPRFLATAILPYVGGLGILALATRLIGEPFSGIFYPAAAAVLAKFIAEIKDKVNNLLGTSLIKHSDGIGKDVD